MYKFLFIFYFIYSFSHATSFPDFQAPTCINKHEELPDETQKFRLAIHVYKSTHKNYTEITSLWDQDYLQKNPDIATALHEFAQGKRAQSLKNIHPKGKTAKDLHLDLIKEGFVWKAVPLLVDQGSEKKYWKLNGEQTSDVADPQVVKMHIYIHPDGGMVRIKASGIPDKAAKYSKRCPHAVMAVLKSFDFTQCEGNACNYDTSYDNEAFKVTSEGMAGPKASSPKYGFKLPIENDLFYTEKLNQFAEDVYMDLVHITLKTDDFDMPTF